MARYTGPKTRIARRFKEPIYGPDKWMERKPHSPGQHGLNKRRGKHDLANRQDDAGAGARNYSRQDEFDKAMRFSAPETSDRRNEAADGEHGPPAPAVCKLPSRQNRGKACETICSDSQTDR